MEVLPQVGQLHAGEGKRAGGSNRFERDGAGPGERFALAQLRCEGIRIVTTRFGMEILEHKMNRDDIEPVGLGLRFIAKFNDPLRNLELPDFDGGKLGWDLLSLQRCGRVWPTVRRHKLSQIHAPVFEYTCGHIGHHEPNGVEHIGPTNERACLKIDEELVKPDQGGLIRLSNFQAL